jgi:hypothetical protein
MSGSIRYRQGYTHARATFRPIVGFNAPAVLFDDLFYNCKPQAGAFWLAGDIGVERVPQHLYI